MFISKKKKFRTMRFLGLARSVKHFHRSRAFMIANDLPSSFKYATQGLIYAFLTQRNFRVHVIFALFASTFAIWLKLPLTNLAIIIICIALVLSLELLNTSIEALVDLSVGKEFHSLARIAKDCSAASVLIVSIMSLIIAMLIFVPELLNRFST